MRRRRSGFASPILSSCTSEDARWVLSCLNGFAFRSCRAALEESPHHAGGQATTPCFIDVRALAGLGWRHAGARCRTLGASPLLTHTLCHSLSLSHSCAPAPRDFHHTFEKSGFLHQGSWRRRRGGGAGRAGGSRSAAGLATRAATVGGDVTGSRDDPPSRRDVAERFCGQRTSPPPLRLVV